MALGNDGGSLRSKFKLTFENQSTLKFPIKFKMRFLVVGQTYIHQLSTWFLIYSRAKIERIQIFKKFLCFLDSNNGDF
jgi:hypothetical protein